MHQVEVDIVYTQGLERGVDSLLDAVMPGVVELGGDPDLLARNTRVPNTLAYLRLVAVRKSTVDSPSAHLRPNTASGSTHVSMWR